MGGYDGGEGGYAERWIEGYEGTIRGKMMISQKMESRD
jgi:hypothetical protein